MLGGVVYEHSQHPSPHFASGDYGLAAQQWSTMPRKDKGKAEISGPSPTYTHLSPIESPAQSSPYHVPQTVVLPPGTAAYQMPYQPHMAHMPSPRVQMTPNGMTYYTVDQQELYQTPTHPSARGKMVQSPYYALPPDAYEGHAQMVASQSAGRSYDTTIPQYYPVTTGERWYAQTPDRTEPGQKRKREKKDKTATPSTARKPRASKQQQQQQQAAKSGDTPRDSPAAKRSKRETHSRSGSQQPAQLPTPPSTCRESSKLSQAPTTTQQLGSASRTPSPTAVAHEDVGTSRRRGVVVTRHQDEGRKLGIVGNAQGAEEAPRSPEEAARLPRTMPMPALTTNPAGLAVFSTDQVLESEVAWLEYSGHAGAQSPPSSPDLVQLRTPRLPSNDGATNMFIEEQETPMTKAEKMKRRMSLFKEALPKTEGEALVSTRIDMFGRVAVRKSVAMKFLGLDHAQSKELVEEMRLEGDDAEGSSSGWNVKIEPSASSSKLVQPSWPDDEAPWALAGGSRKARMVKEEEEKAATLRRYLDSPSDESSDDDEEDDMPSPPVRSVSLKGKHVDRGHYDTHSSTASTNGGRRTWSNPQADAKSALLTTIRHRSLPILPMGKVACVCGANQPYGRGPMIECPGCRTYHHLACNGFGEDDSLIPPQWWCHNCQAAAIAMSTPALTSTPRVYTQSDERSSAFKGEMTNIALAPSPMFVNSSTFTQLTQRTPRNQTFPHSRSGGVVGGGGGAGGGVGAGPGSPGGSKHKSRILSYGTDMWSAYTEDGPGPTDHAPSSGVLPSTPRASRHERFSTPRIEETPFDVTSTPSRHLDFNFGQPSLFSLTPLGGGGGPNRSSRFGSTFLEGTPFSIKSGSISGTAGPGSKSHSHLSDGISRHDFLKELGKDAAAASAAAGGGGGGGGGGGLGSPVTPLTPGLSGPRDGGPMTPGRWPHALLGAHNLSSSPFSASRKASVGAGAGTSGKMSSVRSSSKSGLGLGMPLGAEDDEEED